MISKGFHAIPLAPKQLNWFAVLAVVIIVAVPVYFRYDARDRLHPCYDPNFVPVFPDPIVFSNGPALEPISAANVDRLARLVVADDILLEDFLYQLHQSDDVSFVEKPYIQDTSGRFADATLSAEDDWDGRTGTVYLLQGDNFGDIALPLGWESVHDLAFTPNGRCAVFAGSYDAIRFWDLSADAETVPLIEKNTWIFWDFDFFDWPGGVASLDFDATGRYLAYGTGGDNIFGEEANAGVWDLARSKIAFDFGNDGSSGVSLEYVAMHPEGRFMAGAESSGTITVWDVQREVKVMIIDWHHTVQQVLFDRTGQLLVARTQDGQIGFWDVSTGREAKFLHTHETPVNNWQESALAFSPDMRLMVTVDSDGMVRYWGVPVDDVNTG